MAKSRKALIDVQKNLLNKYGGENSQTTIDARKASTAAKEAVAQAKLDKQFPALPLDPKQLVVDQGYTVKDAAGKAIRVVYIGKNAAGEPLYEKASDYAQKKISQSNTGTAAGGDEEED